MKIKQCLVIDDNEADIDNLRQKLTKLSFFQIAFSADSIELASEIIAKNSVDLIFLDIQLHQQSGLTLLKSVTNLPPIIIISAHPEYAIDSYALGKASDYLLKPFSDERLQIALNRALSVKRQTGSFLGKEAIFLKVGRKIQRFNYESINYIEAFGIYSKVYTSEQMVIVNERLSSLTNKLPTQYFMRIHKSYVINIRQITSYDRLNIWLDKVKIPIGISYRPRLEGLLSLFDTNDDSDG